MSNDVLSDVKRLYDAMLSAYVDYDSVERLASFGCDVRLRHIASPEKGLQSVVYALVQDASARGYLKKLMQAAIADSPNSQQMVALARAVEAPVQAIPVRMIDAATGGSTPTVFVSYSHADDAFVGKLIADLERAGHPVWADASSIRAGDDWLRAIAEGIENSYAFILVATTSSLASPWVRDEVNWARQHEKRIVSALVEDVVRQRDFFPVARLQAVKFHDVDYQAALARLLDALPSPPSGVVTPAPTNASPRPKNDTPARLRPSPRPSLKVNPVDGAKMLYIPAGEFTMGTDEGGPDFSNARPSHKVFLDSYYIYKNDVTVAEYKKFCTATGHPMPRTAPPWGWDKVDYPMVNVTWDDASAYATWAGASLPTEAQWEKAARGTDGRNYPWGNDWDPSKCRCSAKTAGDAGSPSPVGSYPSGASPYGVMDMAGNVWQWCSDRYDAGYYKVSPFRNPTGPSSGTFRVLRGGSWFVSNEDDFRCAIRDDTYYFDPVFANDNVGFRCVARQD